MAATDNSNLNVNPARQDKYFLALGDIPSAQLLTPTDLTLNQKIQTIIEDKNYFNLSLRSLTLPGISLGTLKVDTMFSPLAETDMKYSFEEFTTEIKMDRNFIIYKLLILWMFLIKNPEAFNQYGMMKTFDKTATTGILTITDSFNTPVICLELYELRPVSLPAIPLSYNTEGEEMTVNVTWSYSYFMPKTSTGAVYNLTLDETL